MSPGEAKQILETLAHGVDPGTGEVLAQHSPFNNVEVLRALFFAVRALEKLRAPPRGPLPENSGKSWGRAEDASLLAAFDNGASVQELADKHARTKGAIQSRLIRHGRLPAATAESG